MAQQFEQLPIKVNPPVHRKLTDLKQELEGSKQRQVTFSETIEIAIDGYQRWQALAAEVAET